MPSVKLNSQQEQAVKHDKGPLLIIAGAGTGKTTVITERIKHFIQKKQIKPEEILALTFTEKAAAEMEERVDKIMPYGYTQMWIMTFHSFCETLLREEAIHIGLNPGYKLTTEAESLLLLKKNLFKFNLKYFRPLGNPTKFLEAILQHFARLKDEDITPQTYLQFAQRKLELASDDASREEAEKIQELAQLYQEHETLKQKEGVMDFADLISNTLLLLRKRKNILKKYQNQFKYVLVDEFQDTNYAQNELAILLAGDKKNITVVADDDQAIYRWRGAALSNVIQFKNNFPGAKIVTLTTNYRSTQEILDRAYELIQHNNPNRLEALEQIDKKLRSARKKRGKSIELIHTQRVDQEAEEIAKKITELTQKEELSYKDIAILVRANNHAHPISAALHRHQIPYQFLGPGQLFQKEEVKDLIAYLRVLYDLTDTISLFRILNMDIFAISAREINYLLNEAKKKNLTLFEALDDTQNSFLSDGTKEKLKEIKAMISRHLERIKKDTAGQILYYFLTDCGLFQKLVDYETKKEENISQNIAQFFDRLKTFEMHTDDAGVYAVVEWIDLMMQMGDSPMLANLDWRDQNAVNVMTVHSSKGLEFPVVFLVNLVNDRFPTRERKEKIPVPQELVKELLPEGNFHVQEERRLFYVGITRAQDRLFLTASSYYGEGKRQKKFSPFIGETVPEVLLQKEEKEKITQLSLSEITKDYERTAEEEEKITPHRINTISFSQLQAFEVCPLHFKLQYLLGIPAPSSAPLSFGSSIHQTLKAFYEYAKDNQTLGEEDLHKLLLQNWINEGYLSKEHQQAMLAKGKQILSDYLANHYNPENIPQEIELPFSFYVNNQLRVVGQIDRIDRLPDGSLEIIDYKTGPLDKKIKKYAYQFQLGLYALAARKVNHDLFNGNIHNITVSLFYLEEGEKISTVIDSDHIEKVEQKILDKVKAIEESDYKCSGSILCSDCEYKILCTTKG